MTVDGPCMFCVFDSSFATYNSADAREAPCFETNSFLVFKRRDGYWIRPLCERLGVNHKSIDTEVPIDHRSLIVTPQRLAYVFLETSDPGLPGVEELSEWSLAMLQRGISDVRTSGVSLEEPPFPHLPNSVELSKSTTLIGRERGAVDIALPSIQVSRIHAQIDRVDANFTSISDLGSFNGTFVNGERIRRGHRLYSGDRIDIGPHRLIFTGGSLSIFSAKTSVELIIDNASLSVVDRGEEKVLLHHISMIVRSGELMAILGPSGSGKSLLTKVVGGRLTATAGRILLNREPLATQFELLKQRIAYVPQRDVLHEPLKLGKALLYSALLRLPDDMNSTDLSNLTREVVEQVGLSERVGIPIQKLSGGQVRRASLANEMLSGPGLLLLDEVTSGLDENTDGEMMRLFRQLANAGKTVLCVTHNTGHIEKTCDLVTILTVGGRLAYFGSPQEALKYFGVERLGDIYPVLNARPADEWHRQYLDSPDYQKFVERRSPLILPPRSGMPRKTHSSQLKSVRIGLRQLWLQTKRTAAVKLAQPRWLMLCAIQSIGLTILLGWLFGDISRIQLSDDDRKFIEKTSSPFSEASGITGMFPNSASKLGADAVPDKKSAEDNWVAQKRATMMLRLIASLVMCALWLGCNNASAEIVRERSIFEAEKEVNLRVSSYLASKILFLSMLVSLQIAVLHWGVRSWCNLSGPPMPQFAMMIAVGIVGVLFGLAISAWSRSSEVSTALVPLLLIPQILFAGTMVPLSGLKQGIAEWFVAMHWGYRGVIHQLTFSDEVRDLLALVGSLPRYPTSDGGTAWLMLIAQALLLIVLSYLGLRSPELFSAFQNFRRRRGLNNR